MWGVSVKGACPIQLAPSPPIWVTARVRRSGSQTAIPWQPMPPRARLASGTTVEVLCGQPEQKYGMRWIGIVAPAFCTASFASRNASRALSASES